MYLALTRDLLDLVPIQDRSPASISVTGNKLILSLAPSSVASPSPAVNLRLLPPLARGGSPASTSAIRPTTPFPYPPPPPTGPPSSAPAASRKHPLKSSMEEPQPLLRSAWLSRQPPYQKMARPILFTPLPALVPQPVPSQLITALLALQMPLTTAAPRLEQVKRSPLLKVQLLPP